MTDPTGTDGEWRFDDLRALYVNCTLKRSPERSHTQGLIDRSVAVMERHGVAVEQLRAVDHDIATGVWPDLTTHGWPSDAWPAIYGRPGSHLSRPGLGRSREQLHQPQLHLRHLEPDAPGGAAQAGRRHPGPRQPALGVGGRLPLRLRQPRTPLSGSGSPASADARRLADGAAVRAGAARVETLPGFEGRCVEADGYGGRTGPPGDGGSP
jgi:hypothetical protein